MQGGKQARTIVQWVLVLLLAACGGQESATQTASPAAPTAVLTQPVLTAEMTAEMTAPAAPVEATGVPASTGVPTGTSGQAINPILDQDFPDPDVLQVDGMYYAFSTNTGSVNIQAARSEDLVHWEVLADALPALPGWAVKEFGWAWAPEVTRPTSGEGYVMYFVARFAIGAGGLQCIGAATSREPAGPFLPASAEPFICQRDEGGSIDAASFVDEDGTPYVLWKNDGNSRGGVTWIYIQQVSADGLDLVGEPTRLIKTDQAWEGLLVEAPTLWKQDGKYYLFYSANDYASPRYAVGYAVADNILGPYEKASQPLLKTNLKAQVVGPGGQDIVQDENGDTWILFHDWDPEGFRHMNLARLEWREGEPVVGSMQ
jgi:beta-xylosidase